MEHVLEQISYQKPDIILWEKTQGGEARVLRVYGNQSEILIPDSLYGCPVTEIGPYCFSASSPKRRKDQVIYQNEERFAKEPSVRLPEEVEKIPALCGKFPKAIYLPGTVKTLHNAAFYNCRFLNTLSLGAEISGIGSDEFTNCLRLTRLVIRDSDLKSSGASLILERITTDLDIFFQEGDGMDAEVISVVYFPDYYEMLDEVTPAHLFTRSINGIGFRLRKAFANGILDYKKYDSCMDSAQKTETPSVLWRLAFWRLCFNRKLEEASKALYEDLLLTYFITAAKYFIKEHKLWGLKRLCELANPDMALLGQASDLATEAEWAEGTAYLMERSRPATSFAAKNFDFDLDF